MFNLQKCVIPLLITAIFSILTACGGDSVTRPETKTPPTTKPATSGSGGYYLDDGPGDNPPADIDNIPDATLKTETPLARANKPYTALGQRYTPMTSFSPYKKQGVASWYGKRYHGRKTSSGEVYDMYAMSGAHPTLPLPSYVRVTNPANGRSVIVRINDRGPFKHDRLIDLSYAAAYKLRLIGQGSGLVEVEAIDTSPEALKRVPSTNIPQPTLAADSSLNTATMQYYVQVGAFKNETNGDLLQKKIQALQLAENVGLANVYNNGLYRVRLGPYASKKEADSSASSIRKQLNISAIVQLQ
jgi:rare lipoprotein A